MSRYSGSVEAVVVGSGTHLPTGAAVMPPPGEGELAGADHAHGGPQVWYPDWSLRTQRGPAVSNTLGLSS